MISRMPLVMKCVRRYCLADEVKGNDGRGNEKIKIKRVHEPYFFTRYSVL